jgi:hypothetical protein
VNSYSWHSISVSHWIYTSPKLCAIFIRLQFEVHLILLVTTPLFRSDVLGLKGQSVGRTPTDTDFVDHSVVMYQLNCLHKHNLVIGSSLAVVDVRLGSGHRLVLSRVPKLGSASTARCGSSCPIQECRRHLRCLPYCESLSIFGR